jgi:hypothetical protein
MSWHTMMMADLELTRFIQDFEREYQREIAAGRTAGYTLYARKRDAGDHLVFVPPGALTLFERLPRWKPRLRRHEGMPDLARFKVVPVR